MSNTGGLTDVVFMPGTEGGYHQKQSHDAPGPWDQLDQQEPSNANKRKTKPSYQESPDKAMATVSRTATKLIFAGCQIPANGDAIEIVGQLKGRRFVILQVPAGAAAAVIISHEPDPIQQQIAATGIHNYFTLAVGGAPLMIPAEGRIYGATAAAATSTVVEVIVGNYIPDEIE